MLSDEGLEIGIPSRIFVTSGLSDGPYRTIRRHERLCSSLSNSAVDPCSSSSGDVRNRPAILQSDSSILPADVDDAVQEVERRCGKTNGLCRMQEVRREWDEMMACTLKLTY